MQEAAEAPAAPADSPAAAEKPAGVDAAPSEPVPLSTPPSAAEAPAAAVTPAPTAGTAATPPLAPSSVKAGARKKAAKGVTAEKADPEGGTAGGEAGPKRPAATLTAFTVQCAQCMKWRKVPDLELYEQIRARIGREPFVCEQAQNWHTNPAVSCSTPTDLEQDGTLLWAMDRSETFRAWAWLYHEGGDSITTGMSFCHTCRIGGSALLKTLILRDTALATTMIFRCPINLLNVLSTGLWGETIGPSSISCVLFWHWSWS